MIIELLSYCLNVFLFVFAEISILNCSVGIPPSLVSGLFRLQNLDSLVVLIYLIYLVSRISLVNLIYLIYSVSLVCLIPVDLLLEEFLSLFCVILFLLNLF